MELAPFALEEWRPQMPGEVVGRGGQGWTPELLLLHSQPRECAVALEALLRAVCSSSFQYWPVS